MNGKSVEMIFAPWSKNAQHLAIRLDNVLKNRLHEGIFDSGKTGLVAGPSVNYSFSVFNTIWNFLTLRDDKRNYFISNRINVT